MHTLEPILKNNRTGSSFWAWCAQLLLPALFLLSVVVGCKSREQPTSPPTPKTAPETELVVFAATSLKDTFGALGADFQKSHSGTKIVFNFAGTQELRTQVEQGAVMDVFASADLKHMKALRDSNSVAEPTVFARNEPVLVVAKETVGKVLSLADLPKLTRIVLGAADVPIGRYSAQILDRASKSLGANFRSDVEAKVVSRELNVRQVLAKVRLGEAEAGIVYRTDAMSGEGELGVVTIAEDMNVIAEYPIAMAAKPAHPTLAKAWVELVLSPTGQAVLKKAGFLPPASKAP
jgi:molybdate transport system substrate-binding protein